MLDPRLLYTVNREVWAATAGTGPVLIHLLDGYIDAGAVTHTVAKYLLEVCEHQTLAEFDHDQLHDYRSRRPQMVFDTNHWVAMMEHPLVLYRMSDAAGKVFLLLRGPEPDSQWVRLGQAILGLVEELQVSRIITASGVPMAVPHTRPTLVTEHCTQPELVTGNPMWIEKVQIPGSFSHTLEFRAGEAGWLGQGFVAHIPHYLAQATFPQGAVAVLERIAGAAELDIPLAGLQERAQETLDEIVAETTDDSEFPALVATLEEQYDQLSASGAASVPSADVLAAAVEQFLAEQDPPNGR